MALTDYFTQRFVLLLHSVSEDGEGGETEEWTDGPEFNAVISRDTTSPVVSGESDRLYNTYSIIPDRNVVLNFHDVIRSKKDDKTYRILSDYIETPVISTLDMRQYKGERWDIE